MADDPSAPDDAESPSAPSIPSFASLRDARRRSPVDLLLSGEPAAVEPVAALPPPQPGAPRPPEWADLWNLGRHVARWCLRQPLTTVRRLLG